jgi:zinc and cadmium transporter
MNAYAWLAVYSLLVLLFSVLGGYLPFLGRVTHSRLQLYLSVSAGVMLGAAFFHVMPDAMEMSGASFGWWMAVAVVGLFCIERFIAPHSHELDGGGRHEHTHGHHHDHEEHQHAAPEVARVAASDAGTAITAHPVEFATTAKLGGEHNHDHDHFELPHAPAPVEHRPAAPAVAGWMAVLGLTIHTFTNGVGLAGAVQFDAGHGPGALSQTALLFPGLALFLAIVLHKPADALAISMVLSRKGVSRRKVAAVQFGFALMVPIGVIVFLLARKALEADVQKQLTGAALAFSAGTFLFIALSDLLPEVQFHKHDRIPLFLALSLSVALMGGIALLEGHEHGGHEHGHPGASGHEGEHHDEDHDADHDHDEGHSD